MISTQSRITQQKLDQALTDIRQYLAASKDWKAALVKLGSIKDYSMGEEHLCSASAALAYCAQIKSYFPPSVPASVLQNFDSVAGEIRALQQMQTADAFELLPFALILIGVGAAVYWFLSQ